MPIAQHRAIDRRSLTKSARTLLKYRFSRYVETLQRDGSDARRRSVLTELTSDRESNLRRRSSQVRVRSATLTIARERSAETLDLTEQKTLLAVDVNCGLTPSRARVVTYS